MRKYIIERTIPGASKMAGKDLAEIAGKSNALLRELGPDVQWVETYVTADKIYCVYLARNPELIREHARRGGFPLDSVNEVAVIMDPTTEAQ